MDAGRVVEGDEGFLMRMARGGGGLREWVCGQGKGEIVGFEAVWRGKKGGK